MLIETIDVFDVVALLFDESAAGLVRGQVGTVVELLDSSHVLVEFADCQGIAYTSTVVSIGKLLKLRFERAAATESVTALKGLVRKQAIPVSIDVMNAVIAAQERIEK